jgi:hypothetical protein
MYTYVVYRAQTGGAYVISKKVYDSKSYITTDTNWGKMLFNCKGLWYGQMAQGRIYPCGIEAIAWYDTASDNILTGSFSTIKKNADGSLELYGLAENRNGPKRAKAIKLVSAAADGQMQAFTATSFETYGFHAKNAYMTGWVDRPPLD